MTLIELIRRALSQAGDPFTLDEATSNEAVSYINEGQALLSGAYLTGEMTLSLESPSICLSDIAGYMGAVALWREDGVQASFKTEGGRLFAERGRYTLIYRRAPQPLREDMDVSELPEEYHGALADYATWRLLSNGGSAQQARAQFFIVRFQMAQSAFARAMEARLGARRLRGKYF